MLFAFLRKNLPSARMFKVQGAGYRHYREWWHSSSSVLAQVTLLIPCRRGEMRTWLPWGTGGGQCVEPVRRGRTGELLVFRAAATLDYQQPAVGRSFRWLRIEQFNWRPMNITLRQAGMAKCKDDFPEPTFLDVPLHVGSAPSQTPGFRSTISVSWKKKKNHLCVSKQLPGTALWCASLRLRREAGSRPGG